MRLGDSLPEAVLQQRAIGETGQSIMVSWVPSLALALRDDHELLLQPRVALRKMVDPRLRGLALRAALD